MANYNGSRYIEAALQSALRQSLRDIEIIVGDDASTDDSMNRAAIFAREDNRVQLLHVPTNGGPGAARNLCLEAARGKWIAIMDSDDMMHPERLAQLIAAAERDGADIVADDLLIFDDDARIPPQTCLRGGTAAFWVDATGYVQANTLFRGGQSLGYLKQVIRASQIRDHRLRYDTTLRIAEDFDFILRLLALGARFRILPGLGYLYRKHAGSISHRLSRRTLEPMLAAHDRQRAALGGQDERLAAAMERRRASLVRALDFDDLVIALKQRDWCHAITISARRPSVVALLRRPVIDRLLRPRATGRHASGVAPQVCVVSRQRIIGNTNGSSVYLLGLCAALSRGGYDVHLLCPSPSVFGRWPALVLRPEMRIFRSIRLRRSLRVGRLLIATDPATLWRAVIGITGKLFSRVGIAAGGLDKPAPYSISQPWTRQDALFVARHARPTGDIVIADYAFQTTGIAYALRPDAVSLVIMHDLFSSRPAQFKGLGATDSVATIDQAAEMAMLGRADAVVAIQADEAMVVRGCLPGVRVIVAPVAITPVAAAQPGQDRSLLFVGSSTAPNVVGIRWFLDAVWPLVRARVPDATLCVVGSVCSTMSTVPDGVRPLGPVRDLAAAYCDAALVISPLLAGSGLKIKLIEALGFGKAVVATSVSLQGIDELARAIVAVADGPAEFAAAIITLLTDKALRMARATAGLELARARFSPAACHAELLSFLAGASRDRRREEA
jgi:succinoglycan biosynthesis protein ExoO